jgi:hypothetical protein
MIEHRREIRHRQRFPVTIGRMTVFTTNNSIGGFCAAARRVLTPGTPVEGIIRVRGNEYAYSGRVVWAHSGHPALNLHGCMGVQFTTVAPGIGLEAD